jgi:hypothetical protein
VNSIGGIDADAHRRLLEDIAADRETVAVQPTGADLTEYLHAVYSVCDAVLDSGELLGVTINRTKRGAVSMALRLPGGEPSTVRVYSANPQLLMDTLALFSNLVLWSAEYDLNTRPRNCPLPGHTDTWDLALSEESDNLWRVCGNTRKTIDRFETTGRSHDRRPPSRPSAPGESAPQ